MIKRTEIEEIVKIEGLEEPAIINYFRTINQENYEATAELFADSGQLLAPFEQPIVGRDAIAAYLAQEAKGMSLLPRQGIHQTTDDNLKTIKVVGKARTPLFSVNIAWFFNLNQEQQIISLKIKLLASPQELLGLKKFQS
ncbi:MAG: nuclear transport factor 2 family protein [Cyanobacteria bacterium J06621_8]